MKRLKENKAVVALVVIGVIVGLLLYARFLRYEQKKTDSEHRLDHHQEGTTGSCSGKSCCN